MIMFSLTKLFSISIVTPSFSTSQHLGWNNLDIFLTVNLSFGHHAHRSGNHRHYLRPRWKSPLTVKVAKWCLNQICLPRSCISIWIWLMLLTFIEFLDDSVFFTILAFDSKSLYWLLIHWFSTSVRLIFHYSMFGGTNYSVNLVWIYI
jgi:hypothetical protein